MSAVLEQINVTKSGVNIVPSEKESKKSRFVVPHSNSVILLQKAKVPRHAPNRVQFGMMRNRSLKMLAPISLELERTQNTVIARWDKIEEFGYGRNISEAVDDFSRTLEELYFSLKEKRDTLSDDLKQVWLAICAHIREVRR